MEAKVWGDKKRVKTWNCLDDQEILGRVVADRTVAQVQVVSNQVLG